MAAKKKLGAQDVLWSTIEVSKKRSYLISSDKARTRYSLWLQEGGQLQLITTAPTPVGFYDEIGW